MRYLFLVGGGILLLGTSGEGTEYTLQQAIRTALQQRAALQGVAAQVEGARAQVNQARSGTYPRLNATLGYALLQEAPSFTVPTLGTLTYGETDNRTATAELQWPLYTGGKVPGMIAQAQAGMEMAWAQQAREAQQVVLDVTQAYLNGLKAQALIEVVEQQMKTLQEHRRAVRALYEQGLVPKIDTLRIEVALAQVREQQVKARNGQALAQAALQRAMGVEEPVEVREENGSWPLPESLEAAVKKALRQRPEVRQVESQRRAAQAGVRVARSGRQPQVAAFARNEWERPTYLPETGEWSVGVMLTATLWDGPQTRAVVRRARTQVRQAEAGLEELRHGIRLQVTQAFLAVTSAEERIATTQAALASAQEAHRLADVGYRNDVTPLTDLLDAQAELTRARVDYTVALYDRRLSLANLQFAMGKEVEEMFSQEQGKETP